jgi:hypothetical protein
MEHPVDGGPGHAVGAGQLSEALPMLTIPKDGSAIKVQWTAADVPAFEAGTAHAGPDPLDDQTSFQLGDGADDDDHGPAQRPAGIDRFAEGDELDAEAVQLVQDFEEVANRPSRAESRSSSKTGTGLSMRRPETQRSDTFSASSSENSASPSTSCAGTIPRLRYLQRRRRASHECTTVSCQGTDAGVRPGNQQHLCQDVACRKGASAQAT